jgi:hypothetical protein
MGRMRLNVMMSRRRQVIGAGTGSAGTQSLSGRDRSRKHRYHDRSGWMLEPQVCLCLRARVSVSVSVPVCLSAYACKQTHTHKKRAHTHTHTRTPAHTPRIGVIKFAVIIWCVCGNVCVCVCVCVCVYVCAVRVDGDSGCAAHMLFTCNHMVTITLSVHAFPWGKQIFPTIFSPS